MLTLSTYFVLFDAFLTNDYFAQYVAKRYAFTGTRRWVTSCISRRIEDSRSGCSEYFFRLGLFRWRSCQIWRVYTLRQTYRWNFFSNSVLQTGFPRRIWRLSFCLSDEVRGRFQRVCSFVDSLWITSNKDATARMLLARTNVGRSKNRRIRD